MMGLLPRMGGTHLVNGYENRMGMKAKNVTIYLTNLGSFEIFLSFLIINVVFQFVLLFLFSST